MTIAGKANQAILDIWYDPQFGLQAHQPLMPMVYPDLREGGIVSMGLNPSFSKAAFSAFLHGDEWADFDPEAFYGWKHDRGDFDLVRACEIERLALERYAYYRPFRDLSRRLGCTWQHLDLFAVRATKDERALALVGVSGKDDEELAALPPFADAQVKLCLELLDRLKPDAVVIPNVTVARIVIARLKADFDEAVGLRTTRLGGRSVPVFASSMWTGARALDRYSKELLLWHIEKTVRHRRD